MKGRPRGATANPRPMAEKFAAGWCPEPNSGCWLWTGPCGSNGYGQVGAGKRGAHKRAHRVSWELYRGPIPPGLFVCHRCDTPACVNPDHLFLGTLQDNHADMMAKGRGSTPPNVNRDKVACIAGHAFDVANTYLDPRGRRQCRRCRADALVRFRMNHPGYQRSHV